MEILTHLIDFILHIDDHLQEIIRNYGGLTYLILFLIVFAETGLVVTPILPGDSLLFAAGTFAALGSLDPFLLTVLLIVAAVVGDGVNYWIGHWIGPKAFSGKVPWLRQDLPQADRGLLREARREDHHPRAVCPIVRTFAPFVAGVGRMQYGRFLAYNVVGAVLWVTICVTAGYFFGNLPFVRENFSLVVLGIIGVSLIPLVVEWIRQRRAPAA
jgi:membrane-associated protein